MQTFFCPPFNTACGNPLLGSDTTSLKILDGERESLLSSFTMTKCIPYVMMGYNNVVSLKVLYFPRRLHSICQDISIRKMTTIVSASSKR